MVKMMRTPIGITKAILLILLLGVAMDVMAAEQPMRSREVFEKGSPAEMSGTLRKMGGGWYLAAGNLLHQVYLAPDEYKEEVGLDVVEGEPVTINGYFYAEEGEPTGIIAVTVITVDGKEFRLREDDGRPMWRGRGTGSGSRNQPQE